MRIDKSYGFAGYWVNGIFYRLRGNPDKRISEWKHAISFSERHASKHETEQLIQTILGHNVSADREKQKIINHTKQIEHLTILIKEMKRMRPMHLHAVKMIQQGIIQDNWKGKT